MKQAVSVNEACVQLQELLRETQSTGSEVVITQDGEPVGILMSPLQFQRLMSSRERFWKLVDTANEQYPDLHEDIAMLIALEAVQDVREERMQRGSKHGDGGHA